jgi:catalase
MSQKLTLKEVIIFLAFLIIPMICLAQTKEQKFSPADLVQALHTAFGNNHSRAVHAKGIVFEGTFVPAKEAAALTTAPHLQKQSSVVTVRFSNFTGIPNIADNNPAANPRGFAIRFTLPDGSFTDIVGHSFNGFPTSDSDQFHDFLIAISKIPTETTKPTTLESFLESHPIAKTFLTTQKLPVSFATIDYFGVNSFKFTNRDGKSRFIRYQIISEQGHEELTPEQFAGKDSEYLMKEISSRISKEHIKFKLYAQIAVQGDKIEDPSIPWPAKRERVLLGTIEIKKKVNQTPEDDKVLAFNPRNIPQGIETADPMLDFRSKAYPVSVKERQ